MRSGDRDQLGQQPVGRTGQAEIDHLGAVIDRVVQRLGQAQAVAEGGRGRGDLIGLPAGAQRHQTRARRNARDADAVAGLGRDDAGHTGAVPLSGAGTADNEVLVGDELAREVRMVQLDAAVDDRHHHPPAGGHPVQVRQPPGRRGRLHGVQRIALGGVGG